MAISKDELYNLINQLPENKLKLVKDYVEKLVDKKEEKVTFDDAFQYALNNYDDTFRNLKDR
ncbi:hypothetical protein Q8G32_28525 [Priestia megaterium]|uniref:hypothetical protein n=1 Tax=Priestia megaterium TaxID=1404 RepID=UPI002730A9E3|nr:hypothetical protein [Priestia megaterium]MDP1471788.1 hypothetical protein [Priestia megaterium]